MQEIEIIMIDDSDEDTDLALRELKKSNLSNKITLFAKAPDALEYLSSGKNLSPRLVLLDLNMPGMGGVDFLRELRKNPELKNTPVAVLTSTTELPDIQESLRLGVQYIAKPISFEDIANVSASFGFSIKLVK